MKKYIYFIAIFALLFLIGCETGVKVTFDTDGGTSIPTQDVTETGIVSKPADPEKAGYAFLGWYLDGEPFDFTSKVTKSIKIKAKWAVGVELYFTGNGIEDFSIMVPSGESYELPIPTREGYKFVSWIDEEKNEYSGSNIFTESLFLEANWHKIEVFNIIYRDGDTMLKSVSVTEDETVEEYTPEKEGYTFLGWYTNDSFTKKFDFTKLTRSNPVYAKFVANKYTVSFKGLSDAKDISVTYDQEFGLFPSLTISGSTFVGWSYEGKRVFPSDIYKYTSDIQLEPVIYVKTNFKLSDTESKAVSYLVGSIGPYLNVEKEGKVFAGWYTTETFEGEPIYTITTTEYANKTLYAKFITGAADESYNKVIVGEVLSYYRQMLDGQTIYKNIDLLTDDAYYGTAIEWASDCSQVTKDGIVLRSKQNVIAHLTAKVTYNGYTETETFTITLKEDIYKDISKSVVSTYYYTGNKGNGIDELTLETVDIINLAFAEIQTDGTLLMTVGYLESYNKFKEAARAAGVRVIITVGPASTPERFEAVAKSELTRKKFARNVVEAINEYGFAGVDIDWEYPTETTKGYYTLLMKEIYEQVKENNPEDLVTSAIPGGPYGYPKFDLKNSNKYLDYINLMTYDMHAETYTSHHAALYPSSGGTVNGCSIKETITYFTGKTCACPKNKLVIGAAFYGRKNTTKAKITSGSPLWASANTDELFTSITYTGIKKNYLSLSTCKEYWDATAHAAYCYDTASQMFISYDNPQSIKDKCDYLVDNGLAGIMWWDNGSDTTGELLNAVKSKLSIMK